MRHVSRQARTIACALCLLATATAFADDDDAQDKGGQADKANPLALTAQQQRAVGIVTARAAQTTANERVAAIGLVLDSVVLAAESGEAESSRSATQVADAEVARLRGLAAAGAAAASKTLEAAQAEAARQRALADAAAAKFRAHWAALAALPPVARQKTIAAVASVAHLLVRAELPGRRSLGVLPERAELDIDGVVVPARVLGPAATTPEAQGAGVLLEVDVPPAGLGAGARVPAILFATARKGFVLPRGALFYGSDGAYVFKRLATKPGADKTSFAQVKVSLLMPHGEGWLVDGIDDDDDIVVQGAGALFSLAGTAGKPVAADDDD